MLHKLAKKLLEARRNTDINAFIKSDIEERKFEVAVTTKAVSIDEKNKTAVFVMSTASIDRHGDIIDQESWIMDHFRENPAFFWQHESYNFPLGQWLDVWFEGDPENEGSQRLMGRARFDTDIEELAERAWNHVLKGNLRMVSVGFIPHRVEYDENKDAFVLYDCELLECSLVGIGSNRQALIKDEDDYKQMRKTIIETKKSLDEKIATRDNTDVIAHLKARDLLNKAVRRMKQAS